MKRMKNLLSLVLALVMVMAMTLPALAATVKNETNHPYDAYQIFAANFYDETPEGKENEEPPYDDEILSNIDWGSSMEDKVIEFVTALTSPGNDAFGTPNPFADSSAQIPTLTETSSSEDKAKAAKAIANVLNVHTELANEFAQFVATKGAEGNFLYLGASEATIPADTTSNNQVSLEGGYYLFLDTVDTGNTNEYVNLNLLEVTGPNDTITIRQKNDKPSIDKQVQDNESADPDDEWADTADHKLYEPFSFKLTSVIPSTTQLENYDAYMVKFSDVMSEGVTFEKILSVKVNGKTVNRRETREYNTESDEQSGYYLATEFGEGEDEGTLQTNEEELNKVIAAHFSFTLTIDDILGYLQEDELSEAVTIEVIYEAHLNENATITVPGVHDGVTTNNNSVELVYSNNPNGKGTGKTLPDKVWVFTYEMPNHKYTKNDGQEIAMEGAGFTLYYGNTTDEVVPLIWDDNKDFYRIATETEQKAIRENPDITKKFEITSLADTGFFNVYGLDVGNYLLVETTTPPGFNTCDEMTIVIKADPDHKEVNGEENASVTVKMTVNGVETENNGVENNKGVTLPETGGIGTTIFTVSGIILVIIAGVLLVTKKRMSKEE